EQCFFLPRLGDGNAAHIDVELPRGKVIHQCGPACAGNGEPDAEIAGKGSGHIGVHPLKMSLRLLPGKGLVIARQPHAHLVRVGYPGKDRAFRACGGGKKKESESEKGKDLAHGAEYRTGRCQPEGGHYWTVKGPAARNAPMKMLMLKP